MPPWGKSYRRRRGGGLFRLAVTLLVCAMFIPALVGWGRAAIECRMLGGGDAPAPAPAASPNSGARPEEQTFLTLPEW